MTNYVRNDKLAWGLEIFDVETVWQLFKRTGGAFSFWFAEFFAYSHQQGVVFIEKLYICRKASLTGLRQIRFE